MEIVYDSLPGGAVARLAVVFGNLLLREGGVKVRTQPVNKGHAAVEEKDEKEVRCRSCGYPVTTARWLIAVDGSKAHTFFNPAGIIYEIICFTGAPGCIVQGNASTEFSWFRGHAWRVALCGSCLTQLGWRFESEGSLFFGLIVGKLVGDF